MYSLEHTYAESLPELVAPTRAEDLPDPQLVVFNPELGIDADWLMSTLNSPGYAMAYAGHQFGQYSPLLGDGRAILLGEFLDETGIRRDIHLKGSGRTPYSRPGSDGRGTLSSMLTEYVFSESLHALGVDTTRSLAVITTGRTVVRQNGPEPAAILVRVARGLTRVGTFQLARTHAQGQDLVGRLSDYVSWRHHDSSNELFPAVVAAQAQTVSGWMAHGFTHGVMNTDNTSITGETLDYGPCAWTDTFSPTAVYSSIDTQGRYAFGNQPALLKWNLARFAETLVQSEEEVAWYTAELEKVDELISYEHSNALWVPRNRFMSHVLTHARDGNLEPCFELLAAVKVPYDPEAGAEWMKETQIQLEAESGFITFCGT